jgi:hypothetical protein
LSACGCINDHPVSHQQVETVRVEVGLEGDLRVRRWAKNTNPQSRLGCSLLGGPERQTYELSPSFRETPRSGTGHFPPLRPHLVITHAPIR